MILIITQRIRDLAAEHLRRENRREGRDVWDQATIGEIANGQRDKAPCILAIADALDQLGIEP